MSYPEAGMIDFARTHALLGCEKGVWAPLAGGVSSDIWHLRSSHGECCIKQALPQLKVEAKWEVPTDRNAFEWRYMEVVDSIASGAVPKPIAQDTDQGLFAMAWLAPDDHSLWKSELLLGRVDAGFARAVGDLLGRIHAATSDDAAIASEFQTGENFWSIRLDPYLLETGRRHPDLAPRLLRLVDQTASTRRVLVHGDVSPKNILMGPAGPVLLDAECAWFGDPAFDVAFCLNHLVIKSRVVDSARTALLEAFDAFVEGYEPHVTWEPRSDLQGRVASLLPALALARVDGKSPLEYLSEAQKAELRTVAREAVKSEAESISLVRDLLS